MKRKSRTAVFRARLGGLGSIVGLLTALATNVQAQTKIIVNTDVEVSSITQAELARIDLGKKTFWDSGARIYPSLLDEDSPLTASFLEANLKKTVSQFRAYWKRYLFSGQGTAPKTFASSKLVADYVTANPGSIGIVDGSYTDDRVKFIELKP